MVEGRVTATQVSSFGKSFKAASEDTVGSPVAIQPGPRGEPNIPSDTSINPLYPASSKLRMT